MRCDFGSWVLTLDVSAALHNLAEWGIIVHALFSDNSDDTKKPRESSKAVTAWWWSQLWILLVASWVIFAPSLMEAGLGEQVRLSIVFLNMG